MPKAVLAVVVIGVVAGLVLGGTALFYSLNATSLLIRAIERQNLAGVERAIWWGADVNHTWEQLYEVATVGSWLGMPPATISNLTPLHAAVAPLHHAAGAGDVKIIEALLHAGARVDVFDSSGRTPLHNAAMYGNDDVIRVLLRAGAAVDASPGFDGDLTALHCAAMFDRFAATRQLLQAGADPNRPSRDDYTPVHLAAHHENPAVLRALLAAGGDPHRRTSEGASVLALACSGGVGPVALLLEQGVEVDVRNNRGRTPLFSAGWRHDVSDVHNLLLDAGADINVQDHEGVSVLMEAMRTGIAGTLRLLLERGADPDLRDAGGRTALMVRSEFGDPTAFPAMREALLDAGADINARDHQGLSALMEAARSGRVSIVLLLLKRGADPDLRDAGGRTALMMVDESGWRGAFMVMMEALLEAGADPNLVDDEGMTALMHYERRPRPTEERADVRALLEKFSTDRTGE